MVAGVPTTFYHGTSLHAILDIQKSGFDVTLSGTNAGASLGPGVYITTSLEKALNYAKRNCAAGGVLTLEVDLGRCYKVCSNERSERIAWASLGYDSAWAATGVIGEREENCVRDPARIRITDVVLGNTSAAHGLGYEVRNGRLKRSIAYEVEKCKLFELEKYKLQLARAKARETKAKASEHQAMEELKLLRLEHNALMRLNEEILRSAALQNTTLGERKWIPVGLILLASNFICTPLTWVDLVVFSTALGVLVAVHWIRYRCVDGVIAVAYKLICVGGGLWTWSAACAVWSNIVDFVAWVQGGATVELSIPMLTMLIAAAAATPVMLFACVTGTVGEKELELPVEEGVAPDPAKMMLVLSHRSSKTRS